MKILTLLPDDGRDVLERSLTGAQRLTKAGAADSAVSCIREGRCDAFVLDPGVLDDSDFGAVMDAVHACQVPMLLYATLGPEVARRIVQAVDLAAHELVLRGSDDAPAMLRQRLAAFVAPSAPAILLSRAASHFREFPDRLQAVSVSLFGRSALPRWVNGFAKESGLARRTVDRWMHRGGLNGAARLLDAARLARVWEPLVERGGDAEEVSQRYGYAGLRLLTAHTRRILGVAPRALGDRFTRETFGNRLARALVD